MGTAKIFDAGRLGWLVAAVAGLVALVAACGLGGIVVLDLAFAGRVETVAALLSGADPARVEWAVWIDFALVVSYAIVLSGAARWAATVYRIISLRDAGAAFAAAAVVAAVLDAGENVGLLLLIRGSDSGLVAALTSGAAWVKFGLLVAVVSYVAGAVFMYGTGRRPIQPHDWTLARHRVESGEAASTVDVEHGIDENHKHDQERETRFMFAPDRVGISCSGGGIRSASFNLGALQQLEREDVLDRAEYITAVSGGSYIAGAIVTAKAKVPAGQESPPAFCPRSPEESYLRSHTRYLASNALVVAKAIVRLFGGMAINVLYLVLLLFVVVRPVGWLIGSDWLHPELTTEGLSVGPGTWAALVIAGCLVLTAIIIRMTRAPADPAGRWARVRGWFTRAGLAVPVVLGSVAAALLLVHVVLPWLLVEVPHLLARIQELLGATGLDAESAEGAVEQTDARGLFFWLQSLGLTTVLLGGLRSLAAKRPSKVVMVVGALLVPLLVGSAVLLIAFDGAAFGPGGERFWEPVPDVVVWGIAVGALAVLVLVCTDITRLTLHRFYKERLSSAYILRRTAAGVAEPIPYDQLVHLSEFCSGPVAFTSPDAAEDDTTESPTSGPQLVVCAAANLREEGVTPPGRNAVSFTFSADEIGGPDIGYIPTKQLETVLDRRSGRHLTLPSAIAISGAAVSPAMGKMTIRPLSALLALVNVRLGVWLPNPRWLLLHQDSTDMGRRPGWGYFLRELVGRYNRDDPLLYVSDGGHWENLGLVELIRRGCTEIYCLDAGGDHSDTINAIGQAIALARTELGIEIDLDPKGLRSTDGGDSSRLPLPKRRSATIAPTDHVVGTFRRINDDPESTLGRIVYVKAAVTADAPWDVRAYQERHRAFPNHSTVLQLFDDERFEAYRALGAHAAHHAVGAMKPSRPRRRAASVYPGRRRPPPGPAAWPIIPHHG